MKQWMTLAMSILLGLASPVWAWEESGTGSDDGSAGNNTTTGGTTSSLVVTNVSNVTNKQMNMSRGMMGHAGTQLTLRSFRRPEGPAMAPAEPLGWAAWGTGYGSWMDQDERNNIAGYETDVYGLVVGMDKMFTENFMLGFTLNAGDTEVKYDNAGGELDVDNWGVGVYGSYSTARWFVDGMVNYGWNENESERNTYTANAAFKSSADYDSDVWSAGLGFGLSFQPGGNWIIVPSVRYQFSDYDQEDYTESGGGNNDLDVDDYDTDQHTTTLSVKVGKLIELQTVRIMPQASVGWKHDFEDADRASMRYFRTGGATFRTRGLDPADDAFLFSAGMNVYWTENVSAFVNYDLELKDEFDGHTLSTGLRIAF